MIVQIHFLLKNGVASILGLKDDNEALRDEVETLKCEIVTLRANGNSANENGMTDYQFQAVLKMQYTLLESCFEAGKSPEEILAIFGKLALGEDK